MANGLAYGLADGEANVLDNVFADVMANGVGVWPIERPILSPMVWPILSPMVWPIEYNGLANSLAKVVANAVAN